MGMYEETMVGLSMPLTLLPYGWIRFICSRQLTFSPASNVYDHKIEAAVSLSDEKPALITTELLFEIKCRPFLFYMVLLRRRTISE